MPPCVPSGARAPAAAPARQSAVRSPRPKTSCSLGKARASGSPPHLSKVESGRTSEQLKPGWEGETAGNLAHFGLHGCFGLGLGVLEGGDDQVLEHLGFLRLDEARIDLEPSGIELA